MYERVLSKAASDSGKTGLLLLSSTILSIVATLALTRSLPSEAYAGIGTFVFVGQTAYALLASWPLASVVHFGRLQAMRCGDARSVFWAAALMITPCLVIGAMALFYFSTQLEAYLGGGQRSLWLTAAYILILSASALQVHRLQAEGKFGLATSLPAIDRATLVILVLLLTATREFDTPTARTVVVLSGALALLFGVTARSPGLPRLDWPDVHYMTRFSLPITIAVVTGPFFLWGDFWIASQWLPPNELGCYYLATQAVALFIQLVLVLNIVGGPLAVELIASGESERLRKLYSRSIAQLCLFTSTFIALGIALVPVVLPILLPQSYASARIPLVIMLAGCAGIPVYALSLAILNAYRKPVLLTSVTLTMGVTNLILSAVLVPGFNTLGAAFGKSAAIVLATVVSARWAHGLLDITPQHALPLTIAPAPLSAVLILVLPGHIAPAVAGTVALLTSFLVLRYGQVVAPRDMQILKTLGLPQWLSSILATALRVTQ